MIYNQLQNLHAVSHSDALCLLWMQTCFVRSNWKARQASKDEVWGILTWEIKLKASSIFGPWTCDIIGHGLLYGFSFSHPDKPGSQHTVSEKLKPCAETGWFVLVAHTLFSVFQVQSSGMEDLAQTQNVIQPYPSNYAESHFIYFLHGKNNKRWNLYKRIMTL